MSCIFENINKTDKPLTRLNNNREKTKIKSEMKEKTLKFMSVIEVLIRDCDENLYPMKLDNLQEEDTFPKPTKIDS
jgi:hypothetical protein